MSAKVIAATAALLLAWAARAEPLTCQRAVEYALERNSEIANFTAEVHAASARLGGAELVVQHNPEVSVGAGPRRHGDQHTTDVEASLAQRLELFGQRGARIEVAAAAREAAEARLAARRVGLAAEVRAAFARALATERLVAFAREDLVVTRDSVRSVQRRAELGGVSQLEVNAARTEAGRAALSVAVATRRAATARAELRNLLGADAGARLELDGELAPPVAASVNVEALVAKALAVRPDLMAARREARAAEAEGRLAEREAYPSPVVGARYAREEGADILVGTVTLELPVSNRNQAGRGVAAARLSKAVAELAAVERRVQAEVRLAVERSRDAAEAVAAYEGEAIQSADANVTLAGMAYEAGKIGIAELLLIRRGAVEARREHVEALLEAREAEAELARAVGSEALVPGGDP